jgi:hypothetical protein
MMKILRVTALLYAKGFQAKTVNGPRIMLRSSHELIT